MSINHSIRRTAMSLLVTAISSAALAAPAAPAKDANAPKFDSGVVSGLGARNIGSATMSGRIAAVAAMPGKTARRCSSSARRRAASGSRPTAARRSSRCSTSSPCSRSARSRSIPRITRRSGSAPANPGRGNSVSVGNGIYKSTDGGETWTKMGLDNSERIAKVLIDPRDGNTVYACAPGKLWSDSPDRGLYKTTDGGKTWSLVLKGKNLSTGCSSISLDPKDPNTLFAALWDFRRKGWTFRSGGDSAEKPSGSGLFRSSDGGASWTEITDAANKGFPKKPYGRLAVAVAPSASNIVYAFVESTDSALYQLRRRRQGPGTSATRASSWSGVRSISPISSSIRPIPIACSSPISISS